MKYIFSLILLIVTCQCATEQSTKIVFVDNKLVQDWNEDLFERTKVCCIDSIPKEVLFMNQKIYKDGLRIKLIEFSVDNNILISNGEESIFLIDIYQRPYGYSAYYWLKSEKRILECNNVDKDTITFSEISDSEKFDNIEHSFNSYLENYKSDTCCPFPRNKFEFSLLSLSEIIINRDSIKNILIKRIIID